MKTLQRLRTGLRLDTDQHSAADSATSRRPSRSQVWREFLDRVDDLLPGLRAGFVAAMTTWSGVLLFVALAWGTTAAGTADFTAAVGFASAVWMLAHGAAVAAPDAAITLTPLGLWLVSLWVTLRALERGRGRDEVAWMRLSLDFLGGYGAAILVAGLVTVLGPVRLTLTGLLSALGVPVGALALELVRAIARADDRLPAGVSGMPVWAVRGIAPAGRGLRALAALAAAVLSIALLVRWDAVTGLYAAVAPGLIGGMLLTLGQLCYLPTLGMWALSVVAGPGFHATTDGHIGLDGSHPGLLPMLPALGLIPADGEYPGWTKAALALPVLVGLLVGRWADQEWPRLGSWRAKALTASVAVGLVGLATWVLAALAAGSAGSGRLAEVGLAPGASALALTGLVALGSLLWLGWIAVADRIRH